MTTTAFSSVTGGGGRPRHETAQLAVRARWLAENLPETVLFQDAGHSVTAAAIFEEAEALSNAFSSLGLRRNDVISFQLPNWKETAVVNLAAAMCGLVVNPIVPIYREAEVQQMLLDSRSKLLIIPATFRNFDFPQMVKRLRNDLPDLHHVMVVRGPDEGALSYDELVAGGRGRPGISDFLEPTQVKLRLYTSGTTGRAKAVLHSQQTLDRFIHACATHWELKASEPVLMPSPVTHITGYGFGLEMPFLANTVTVFMDQWNAAAAIDLIEGHEVVATVSATPFLAELLESAVERETALVSLRIFGCGGAPVPPDLIRRANAQFHRRPAFRVFGCSELPMITLGRWDGGEPAACTDGRPVDYGIKIVGADGAQAAVGLEGEVWARGPAMFLGYADAEQTAQAMTVDGWYKTGDIGVLSESGDLTITGRKKDLIIRGGENISAKEVEDALLFHPLVKEAAVVAMPHERLGEGVCAFVVLRGQVAIAELKEFVLGQGLARQKCPERFEIIESLPKTASGKIRKDVLRLNIKEMLATSRELPV